MDISQIKASEVTIEAGIHIAKKDSAPVKVMTFVNLRCPYCRKWHEDSKAVLAEFIEAGKIELIIKPFDKEKETLQRGNVTHRFLDYTAPFDTWSIIDEIYATQDIWGNLTLEEVANYMQDELALTEQNNQTQAEKIALEAKQANIVFVPTVIVGTHIFDEHITPGELRNLLENEYTKAK